ncbi:Fimbrial protein precursor [compost metagenome]
MKKGFTIVELLIVIVIIGILAAITIVAYNGIQDRARQSKIDSDLSNIATAIKSAQALTGKTMNGITGNGNIGGTCTSKAAGTDLASLSKTTDTCWTAYLDALDKISVAGDTNIRNLVDPWNRPYYLDGNEGEMGYGGGCVKDQIAAYAMPFAGTTRTNLLNLPIAVMTCP